MRLLSFLSIACMLLLESCNGKFKDGTSVFAGGLWLVPTVAIVGGIIFILIAIVSHNSGSNLIDAGATTNKEGGKVPLKKMAKFWGGVILVFLGLAAWIGINYFRA